jgi:hypothetical protein
MWLLLCAGLSNDQSAESIVVDQIVFCIHIFRGRASFLKLERDLGLVSLQEEIKT